MKRTLKSLFLLLIFTVLLSGGERILAAATDVTNSLGSSKKRIETMTSLFSDACGALMEEAEVGKTVKLSFVDPADRRTFLKHTVSNSTVDMDAATLSRRLFDHVTILPEDVDGDAIGNIDLVVVRILQIAQGKYRVEGNVYLNAGNKKKTEDYKWGIFRLNLTAREHTYFGYVATELACKKQKAMTDAESGSDIVRTALRYVGGKYVWGGTSLKTGVDCSGFVYCILRATGHYHGGRLVSTDWAGVGKAVKVSEAQAGDIIVWDGHVAIYMGGGKMVHASNSKPYPQGGIKVSNIGNPRKYSRKHAFLGIRRVR